MESTDPTRPSISAPSRGTTRRTVVRTAAWTAPAVSLVSATPAFAATLAPWTVTSTSWEGTAAGTRNGLGTYQMRFSVNVPAGTTITAPTATLQFGTGPLGQIRAGLGAPAGWTSTTSDGLLGLFGTIVFTRAAIAGSASVTLDFSLNTLFFSGAGTVGTITFTTTTPGQPSPSFALLRQNAGASPGFITTPPA